MIKVYHIQSDLEEHIPITRDKLVGRVLFTCRNQHEWLPKENLNVTNAIYEIGLNIDEDEILKISIWDDYHKNTSYERTSSGELVITINKVALSNFNKGYKAIELVPDNDRDELSEITMLCDKDNIGYVKLLEHIK